MAVRCSMKPWRTRMHGQPGLLALVLDRHEAHVRALNGLADGCGIGRVVLAAPPAQAIGNDEFRGDQPNGVAKGLELARPMMGARAGFHCDGARWQRGDQLDESAASDPGLNQCRFSDLVDPMDGEDILGEIDADEYDGHGLPLSSEVMRVATPSWHWMPFAASLRLARDGEVPFIR